MAEDAGSNASQGLLAEVLKASKCFAENTITMQKGRLEAYLLFIEVILIGAFSDMQ